MEAELRNSTNSAAVVAPDSVRVLFAVVVPTLLLSVQHRNALVGSFCARTFAALRGAHVGARRLVPRRIRTAATRRAAGVAAARGQSISRRRREICSTCVVVVR